MKRADLKVGQEYLASSSNDWNTGRAYDRPERVRVVSIADLVTTRNDFGVSRRSTVDVKGADGTTYTVQARLPRRGDRVDSVVVVELDRKTGLVRNNGKAYLLRVAAIRTTWEEGAKVLDDLNDRARKARLAREAAEADRAQFRRTTAARLEALGVDASYIVVSSNGTVALTRTAVAALLDLAEQATN